MADIHYLNVCLEPPAVSVQVHDASRPVVCGPAKQCHSASPHSLIVNSGAPGIAVSVGVARLSGSLGFQIQRYIWGEDIAANEAVYLGADNKVYKADAASGAGVYALLGLALEDGLAGDFRPVQLRDGVEIPAANFTPDLPVVLGVDGALAQARPAGLGWHVPIGRATSPTRIEIDIDTPIRRLT